MSRAGSISEVVQVGTKLDDVRGKIEQAQGRLNLLGNQVELATISVSLTTTPVAVRSDLPRPAQVFVDAFEVSLTVALLVANGLTVVLVALIWLLPMAIAAFAAWRLGRRVVSLSVRHLPR